MCAASERLSQPILIVEDSREDYETTVRAFRKAGVANSIYVCEDGDEALDYLYGRGKYANGADAPRPGVILLDLNLPGTDGREVLAVLKADDNLKRIPVIVLTTSSNERDIEDCYAAGANSYIQKPVSLNGHLSTIQRLKEYWYEIVVLPKST